MKKQLRRDFKEQFSQIEKAALQSGWRALGDGVVGFCLEQLKLQAGSVVTLFGGLPDEVDLVLDVSERLRLAGLRLALFGLQAHEGNASDSRRMDAFLIEGWSQVRRGKFGIWEPDSITAERIQPEEIAVILVPGLYFSALHGARLGRGGGYFDRYLSRTPRTTLKVGVALDWQVVPSLPVEPHDQGVDWLVTEQRVIECARA